MDRTLLRPLRRLLAAPIAIGVTWLGASCAELDQIDPDYCGNRVVEEGEDCDGVQSGEQFLCGTRGTQHECRFVWETESDCPDGYVASADKRCRRASGIFSFEISYDLRGTRPQVADVDGDGVAEVALTAAADGFNAQSIAVYSVSTTATPFATIPTSGGARMVDVSNDGDADIVVGISAGAGMGQPNRDDTDTSTGSKLGDTGISVLRSPGLDLKFYANDALSANARFATLPRWLFDVTDDVDLSLLGLLELRPMNVELCALDLECSQKSELPNFAPDADIVSSYDDSHVVFSAPGSTSIVYVARDTYAGFPLQYLELHLAEGARLLGAAHLADVDGDGLDDLVALGGKGDLRGIYVLPGRPPAGSATWSAWTASDELSLWFKDENGLAVGEVPHFAVAHINGDALADFLVGASILVSRGETVAAPSGAPPALETAFRVQTESWDTAQGGFAVGDLNGDGFDDVVAQSFDPFFGSVGPLQAAFGGDLVPLVEVDLEASGFLSRAAIADFDGDGAGDIVAAFAPIDNHAVPRECSIADELVIAYGRAGAYPESPSSIGFLPAVAQIVSGRFYTGHDGFGDFALAAKCLHADNDIISVKNATLFGNSLRLVNTPFTFDPDEPARDGALSPVIIAAGDVVPLPGRDRADSEGGIIGHQDLLVYGTDNGEQMAWLLPSWGDAELDANLATELALPDRLTTSSDLYATDVAFSASPNLVAIATASTTTEEKVIGDFMLESVTDDRDVSVSVELELPEVSTVGFSSFVRVASAVDPDVDRFFVVVYGATQDGIVVAGDASSDFQASLGVESTVAIVVSDGAVYSVETLTGLAQGEVPVDVVTIDEQLVVVTQTALYTIDVANAALVPVELQKPWTAKITDAAVGDFNGDGLEDILVLDGLNGYLVAQLPDQSDDGRNVKHVALLRGINLGGKNRLAMKDLARLFTEAGCEEVKTLIQSGNVVYTARPAVAKTLSAVIEHEIGAQFGLSVPIVVRTSDEMKTVVAKNPFPAERDIEHLHVAFLGSAPTKKQIAALNPERSPPDQYIVQGKDIYLRFPNGVGRTKLSNAYFDSVLSTVSTMRNWRTVNKLLELMRPG